MNGKFEGPAVPLIKSKAIEDQRFRASMVDRGWLNSMHKDLSFVDSRVLGQAAIDEARPLPDGFKPGSFDVICSRGAFSYNHGKL